MKKIQFQVLRFFPDKVSGEFVNLGVIVFDPSEGTLAGKFITKIGNISSIFPSVNSWYLIKCVKTIEKETKIIANRLTGEFAFENRRSIEIISQMILPKDDTSLVFSEMKQTLDINPTVAVQDLFSRYVKSHLAEEDDEVRRDNEVWQKVYKKHFDKYGITTHFRAHKVKTKSDEHEFERAWKNGAWNCFEAVSFNLNRSDSIKNKVYKWVGKLDDLSNSKEPIHIYLLSVLPHEHAELTSFITKKIKAKSTTNTKIEIVSEENVENFTRKLGKEIGSH